MFHEQEERLIGGQPPTNPEMEPGYKHLKDLGVELPTNQEAVDTIRRDFERRIKKIEGEIEAILRKMGAGLCLEDRYSKIDLTERDQDAATYLKQFQRKSKHEHLFTEHENQLAQYKQQLEMLQWQLDMIPKD